MVKEYLNPSTLPNWAGSFSQVVVVRTESISMIYVSGQVSVDAQNEVIGRGDLARQVEVALGNLAKALEAAGATPADVVRLRIYVKDYRSDQAGLISAALGRMFDAQKMPSSTWLGVASLALEDLLFEVEATAVIDGENKVAVHG